METYVTLVTGTGTPEGMQAAMAAIEAEGCKVVNVYTLMGRYDSLLILEAPDSATLGVAVWKARAVSGADIRTETSRAFTMTELQEMMKRVS